MTSLLLAVAWSSSDIALMVCGVLSLLGVVFTSVMSHKGHKQASEANRAVNRRPVGQPTLYDLVAENHADVRHLGYRVSKVEERVDGVSQELAEHDRWERECRKNPE